MAGCAVEDADTSESNEAAHTEGEYVHVANGPFSWADVDYEALRPFTSYDLASALGPGDKLTARMQAWANRIDKIVRERVERAAKTKLVAPKPIVKILPAKNEFNAWSRAVPVCLGVPFGPAAESTAAFMLLGAEEHVLLSKKALPTCPTLKSPWPAVPELAKAWAAAGGFCDLELTGDRFKSRCEAGSSAANTAVFATTPFIHITTDLLGKLDEREAVLVLAHELGHYYRAHTSPLSKPKYGFWYEQDPTQPGRPVPSERAREIDTHYRNVFAAPLNQRIPNAQYHPRLRALVSQIATTLLAHTEDTFVCNAARSKVGAWTTAFTKMPPEGPSQQAKDGYLAFEAELVSCAKNLKIVAGTTADASSLTKLEVDTAFKLSGFKEISTEATLEAALKTATTAAQKMDDAETEMLAELRKGKIGLYTDEQEADDMAIDLVTKLGMQPNDAFESWLAFMSAAEKVGVLTSDQTGELGAARCKELLAAGFTAPGENKDTRVPVQMTLGKLEDPHHGNCYRLYNMWRENRAHAYAVVGAFSPPPGPPWAELKTHALQLSGLAPDDLPPPAKDPKPPTAGNEENDDSDSESSDVPIVQKKKKTTTGGCATAVHPASASSPLAALALGAAALLVSVRRRRRTGAP